IGDDVAVDPLLELALPVERQVQLLAVVGDQRERQERPAPAVIFGVEKISHGGLLLAPVSDAKQSGAMSLKTASPSAQYSSDSQPWGGNAVSSAADRLNCPVLIISAYIRCRNGQLNLWDRVRLKLGDDRLIPRCV